MSYLNIEEFSNDLRFKEGIYYSKGDSNYSYLKEGNKQCFQLEEQSYWFKHRNNCIKAIVELYPPNGFIFDIGGGNGFVSKQLIEHGFDCVLVEPCYEGIKNGKSRGINNLICSGFENAKFKSNSLTNVGIFDVIEHIENDKLFLNNLYNKLKYKGKLYVTVPAYQFLWSNEDEKAGHFRRYTKNVILKQLENVGFKILYSSYFFSYLVFPIFFGRTLIGKVFKTEKQKLKENQYISPNFLIGNIINFFSELELKLIKKNKNVFFGSSILIVAEK